MTADLTTPPPPPMGDGERGGLGHAFVQMEREMQRQRWHLDPLTNERWCKLQRAAAAITADRDAAMAEVTRLRGALDKIVRAPSTGHPMLMFAADARDVARAALAGTSETQA